jgi:hypothetical protein
MLLDKNFVLVCFMFLTEISYLDLSHVLHSHFFCLPCASYSLIDLELFDLARTKLKLCKVLNVDHAEACNLPESNSQSYGFHS